MEFLFGSLLLWLLFVVLMIVWIILPFAVFGINKRLDHTNRKLDELIRLAGKGPKSDPVSIENRDAGSPPGSGSGEGRNPKINQDF